MHDTDQILAIILRKVKPQNIPVVSFLFSWASMKLFSVDFCLKNITNKSGEIIKKINAEWCSEMNMLYLSLQEIFISTSLKWTEDKSNSSVVTKGLLRRQHKQTHT